MLVAGIDVGSITTKLVFLQEDKIVHHAKLTGGEDNFSQNLEDELKKMGRSQSDLDYIVATGVGRGEVSFAEKKKSTALCLAKGAYHLFPSARTAIDIGGETSTVVGLNEKGNLMDSAGNDKCASGAGSFLLLLVKLLNMPLDELSRVSLSAKNRVEFTTTCAVFIEQEVISYIHRDNPLPISDVVAGIYSSLATRIVGLAKKIGIKEGTIVCGGVARNNGFIKILEEGMGTKIRIPDFPEIIPALGAALIAAKEV